MKRRRERHSADAGHTNIAKFRRRRARQELDADREGLAAVGIHLDPTPHQITYRQPRTVHISQPANRG